MTSVVLIIGGGVILTSFIWVLISVIVTCVEAKSVVEFLGGLAQLVVLVVAAFGFVMSIVFGADIAACEVRQVDAGWQYTCAKPILDITE